MKVINVLLVLSLCLMRCDAVKTALRSSDQQSRSLGDNGFFACGSSAFCVAGRSTCVDDSKCVCLKGFGGPLCEPEDECKATTYPCAGGNTEGSFCVNYDPPRLYKCGCVSPGYTAVLPNQADVMDPVPASWRPTACVKQADPATPSPVASDPSVPSPTTVSTPSPVDIDGSCTVASDCTGGRNFECNAANKCACPVGFVQVGPNCQLENECRSSSLNNCHKFATCQENDPLSGFSCQCSLGYEDKFPAGLNATGTVCQQINECTAGTHDCAAKNLTCVDRTPPMMWDCIEPTPAPTKQPTPSPTVPRPLVVTSAPVGLGLRPFCAGVVDLDLGKMCPVEQMWYTVN